LSEERESILIAGTATLRRELVELLESAGYQTFIAEFQEHGFGIAEETGIDLLLLELNLVNLQHCVALVNNKDLLAESRIRLIVLISGGVAERVSGLDLGADDVLSVPWDSTELLARVRTQLRQKREADAVERKMRISDEGRQIAHTAFQALAVTEKMTRDAFSLDRALKIGVSSLFAVALAIVGIFLLYSRRADKESKRAYGLIAQLEHGVQAQEMLLKQTDKAREYLKQVDVQQQKEQLQQQTDELRQKMAGAPKSDVAEMRKQLNETTNRLRKIEGDSVAAEGVIRSYAPSICLLHVSVALTDKVSHRKLRYGGINPDGEPLTDGEGKPVYTLEGHAPEVHADFFGTGFIAGDGKILTNHHVAQPWWENDELNGLGSQGLEPVIAGITAYFPDSPRGVAVEISEISREADLAVLRGDFSGLKRPTLKIDGRKEAAISGQTLLSLGYATGLSAILARAGDDTVKDILKMSGGDPKTMIEELAKRGLIRPLVTQGHIGDVLPDKIVYDAQTTSGGSGGPLINHDGEVVGVTFAVLKGFGGSNFGVPIRYAEPILGQ
jgi:DNA-binding response OmpR family regulator